MNEGKTMVELTPSEYHFCPECEEEAHHMLDRFGEISEDELKCSACGLIFKEVK